MFNNQRGFFLQEALLGLIVLQVIILSLLQLLPILLTTAQLQIQTTLMHTKLFEVADELLTHTKDPFTSKTFLTPFEHTITLSNQTLCVYFKGDFTDEQSYCLSK